MFALQVAGGIELRQFEDADSQPLYAAVCRNREHLRQWLPWVDLVESQSDIHSFIARTQAQFETGLGPNFGVWLDGSLAGAIGCHPFDRVDWHCSLGYWLEAGRQGNGTITRCCRRVLDYLFEEQEMHRVTIRCASGNLRSCAIPRRLGFRLEGVLREGQWVNDRWLDLNLWAILEQEWRAQRETAELPTP